MNEKGYALIQLESIIFHIENLGPKEVGMDQASFDK